MRQRVLQFVGVATIIVVVSLAMSSVACQTPTTTGNAPTAAVNRAPRNATVLVDEWPLMFPTHRRRERVHQEMSEVLDAVPPMDELPVVQPGLAFRAI